MGLVESAFEGLFPGKGFSYTGVVCYSGRFKGFNANVRLNRFTKTITFSLSKNWRGVDSEIQIGLLQSLMLRLFKKKRNTVNIGLYHNFLKNAHLAVPKAKLDPVLRDCFNRVNRLFFAGMIDMPNLVVGRRSVRTLGQYDYGSDTITISRVLLDYPDLLDYVMYHEMLHKKHKFSCKNGRTLYHSSIFRKQEKQYPNAKELEEKLARVLKSKNCL